MKKNFLIIFVIMAIVLEYVGYLKHFQILGLFFDIIGAYYLAQSSITKKLEDVVCESFGDENEKYPGGLSDNLGQQDRTDAQFALYFNQLPDFG